MSAGLQQEIIRLAAEVRELKARRLLIPMRRCMLCVAEVQLIQTHLLIDRTGQYVVCRECSKKEMCDELT